MIYIYTGKREQQIFQNLVPFFQPGLILQVVKFAIKIIINASCKQNNKSSRKCKLRFYFSKNVLNFWIQKIKIGLFFRFFLKLCIGADSRATSTGHRKQQKLLHKYIFKNHCLYMYHSFRRSLIHSFRKSLRETKNQV